MSDSEDDDDDVMGEEEEKALEQARRAAAARGSQARRSVLCAEPLKADPSWKPPSYAKNAAQTELITKAVAGSFLFKSLRPDVSEKVIGAFRGPLQLERGTTVIIEGTQVGSDDPGLYVLETGSLNAYKAPPGCPDIRPGSNVCTYDKPGQIFGELALLYDCPRAASIVAASDSVLWSLDRNTFNNCVKGANMGARQKMQAFLSSVEILHGLTDNDRDKIVDVLEQRDYKPGETIIRKGEEGTEFFMLVAGKAQAILGGQPVQAYAPGSYFGELALLRGEPRAADVIACAQEGASCAVLGGGVFRRLLGPLSQEMAQRAERYTKMPSTPFRGPSEPSSPLGMFGGCCSCTLMSEPKQRI